MRNGRRDERKVLKSYTLLFKIRFYLYWGFSHVYHQYRFPECVSNWIGFLLYTVKYRCQQSCSIALLSVCRILHSFILAGYPFRLILCSQLLLINSLALHQFMGLVPCIHLINQIATLEERDSLITHLKDCTMTLTLEYEYLCAGIHTTKCSYFIGMTLLRLSLLHHILDLNVNAACTLELSYVLFLSKHSLFTNL